MKFEKVTNPKDYQSNSCKDHFEISYGELVQKLGEPFKNGDPGFPDDDHKVDVCWCFAFEAGHVSIWNYKNGPAYLGGEGVSVEDITCFSFDYPDDETLKLFCKQYGISRLPEL